jgi:hypothetical protein
MRDDDVHDSQRRERRRARPRRAGLLATAAGLAVLAAACSAGPAQPGAGAGSPGSAGSGPLAYSRCMRAHGISDFPDPNPSGGLSLPGPGNGGDLLQTNPKNQAAQKACQSLMNAGLGTPAQRAKNYAAALKYAACMRAHGLINYPDPKPPGNGPNSQSNSGGQGGSGSSQSGLDPNSPQYIAANKACQHYMSGVQGSGPDSGPGLSSGGGS